MAAVAEKKSKVESSGWVQSLLADSRRFFQVFLLLVISVECITIGTDLLIHYFHDGSPRTFSQDWFNTAVIAVSVLYLVASHYIAPRQLVALYLPIAWLTAGLKSFLMGGVLGPYALHFLIPILLTVYYYPLRFVVLSMVISASLFVTLYFVQSRMGIVAPIFRRPAYDGVWLVIYLLEWLLVLSIMLFELWDLNLRLKVALHKADYMHLEAAAKDKFVARVSHELRTPLTSLLGFSELLRKESEGSDDKVLKEGIYLNSLNLLTMINNLLDINKISYGQFKIQPRALDIPALVADLRKMFQPGLARNNLDFVVHIDPDPLPLLMMDPICTERILVNLVSNAIKFTHSGRILVDLVFRAGVLELTVSDTGKGMVAEDVRHVFEPYYQSIGDNSGYVGTGLGLALVKELVDRLGGRVELFSTRGKGTQIRAILPTIVAEDKDWSGNHQTTSFSTDVNIKYDSNESAVVPPHEGAPELSSPQSDFGPEANIKPNPADSRTPLAPSVLFVEDQDDIRMMIRLFMENSVWSCAVYESWDEVDKKDLSRYRCAFIDLRLPVVDGYEICRRLKEVNPTVQVWAMTAQVPEGGEVELFKEGFDGVLPKPFTLNQLLQTVEKVCHDN